MQRRRQRKIKEKYIGTTTHVEKYTKIYVR